MKNNELTISEIDGRRVKSGQFESWETGDRNYYKTSEPLEGGENSLHLVMLHDLGDYHGRYQILPSFLTSKMKNNLTITWFDFKGHGMSKGARGHVNSFNIYCEDLAKLLNIVTKPGQKVVLIGQGMGALVALKLYQLYYYRLNHEINGLILSNPILKLNIHLPLWSDVLLIDFDNPLRKLRLPYRLDGHDLTSDDYLAEQYNSDPLIIHGISIGLYKETIRASNVVRASSYFIDLPTLILVGEKDNIVDHSKTELFFKGMPKDSATMKIYPDAKHDLLNEVNRDIVYDDVYNWLKNKF